MATWASACERLLRQHGGVIVRQGRRHVIWDLNGTRFIISRGARGGEFTTKQAFHIKLRRALAARKGEQ